MPTKHAVQSLCTTDQGVGGCQRHQTPVLLTRVHKNKERFGFGVSEADKIEMMQKEVVGAFRHTGCQAQHQLTWEQRIIPTEKSGFPSPDFLGDSCASQPKELPHTA